MLLKESDPAKGSDTLAELRAECPKNLQPAIFNAGRQRVLWHCIEEFQLVSLKMIAGVMLLESPVYS